MNCTEQENVNYLLLSTLIIPLYIIDLSKDADLQQIIQDTS